MRLDVPAAIRPAQAKPTQLQTAGEWGLHLPFSRVDEIPSLNDREHWAVKAKKIKAWREAARLLARQARIPACDRIKVELHYVPRVERNRDQDNLVLALKPLVDGLVDAGVVADDTQRYIERTYPVIHPARSVLPTRADTRFVLRVFAL